MARVININEFSSLNNFVCATGVLKNDPARIAVDNRNIEDENVFIAIVGERYNPLIELFKLEKKVKYIVHEKNVVIEDKYLDKFIFIKVKNIVSFCQEVGGRIAENFQRTNILFAIAGSNGKTTTKEMLSHIMSYNSLPYIATQKNNNNHLGVPFTLFQIRKETQFAIIELGSNHPEEMEVLNSICKPRYGVVTNIGHTHMEFFPTLKDVFKEEKNIFDHIEKSSSKKIFFRNDDDEFLSELKGDFCLGFGHKGKNYSFSYENEMMTVTAIANNEVAVIRNEHITGKHNFYNLALTYVIAKELTQLPTQDIIIALKEFRPTPNRGEWKECQGKKIFLDAYNANPSSMIASLEGFRERVKALSELSRAVVVLGDMNELGENLVGLHQEVAKKLSDLGFENVRFIGRYAAHYLSGFPLAKSFLTAQQYREESFLKDCESFDYFLIKGSRSLQLESILDIK